MIISKMDKLLISNIHFYVDNLSGHNYLDGEYKFVMGGEAHQRWLDVLDSTMLNPQNNKGPVLKTSFKGIPVLCDLSIALNVIALVKVVNWIGLESED